MHQFSEKTCAEIPTTHLPPGPTLRQMAAPCRLLQTSAACSRSPHLRPAPAPHGRMGTQHSAWAHSTACTAGQVQPAALWPGASKVKHIQLAATAKRAARLAVPIVRPTASTRLDKADVVRGAGGGDMQPARLGYLQRKGRASVGHAPVGRSSKQLVTIRHKHLKESQGSSPSIPPLLL